MDKLNFKNYSSSDAEIIFDQQSYVEPANETEVRKQLSYPLKQIRDYINKVITVDADGTVILLRLTESELFQYSLDGKEWHDTASGGHEIFDGNERQLPQRTKLMFKNTSVYNESGFTVVEGITGRQGIGVASVVQVSSSSTSLGQNVWRMTLTNGNTYDFIVLNGARGEDGEKGEQGNGLVILGTYATLEDLQMAHPTGNEGDVYIVGTGDSNPAYVWDINDHAWETIGKIRGEKGAKGDPGTDGVSGVGVQSVIETQHSTVSGGTNIWTVTLTNGIQNTFTVLNGEEGRAGEGVPQGGTVGQILTKKTSLDYDAEWDDIDALPTGGSQGQVLTKQSSTDGDADWEDIQALPTGGTQGQYLVKESSTEGDANWQTKEVELTQAQYDALPNSKLTDGVSYYITDGESAPSTNRFSADGISYGSGSVADALDALSLKREAISGTTDANGNLSLASSNSKTVVLFVWNNLYVFIPFFFNNVWYARVQRADSSGTALTNTAVSCDVLYM